MSGMDGSGDAAALEPWTNAVLIAGPTASGKSALAMELAGRENGIVVNTDSMQVYSVLRVLTARPGDADLKTVPHHLYGHVDPRQAYSTGQWMRDVEQLLRSTSTGRRVVFVGGTGLYFRALLEGLSSMPEVPAPIREKWRAALLNDGAAALHALLERDDPQSAAVIRPNDGQRIVRALEVLEASRRPISYWQGIAGQPLVDRSSARLIVLEPDRDVLRQRIDMRFDTMMEQGALDEARALHALNPDPAMPVMKAIGVRELIAADQGEMRLEDAIDRAKTATKQYAKRQSTWFRNQLGPGWTRVSAGQAALKD